MSGFSKVMDNKVSELNSENVAERFRPTAQGLGLGLLQYQMTCHLGLHKSVPTTRGNHTGLAKPFQPSQVKRIQPKT